MYPDYLPVNPNSASECVVRMSYYYLVATLPMFPPEGPPPMSGSAFLALCREHLRAADFARLERLWADAADAPADESDFVSRWQSRDIQIRNAAARVRAGRLRRDAAPFLHAHPGMDATLEKSVAEALGKDSPLEREASLDKLRWTLIDELAGTDPFAAAAVFAYALKLRIAERWSAMTDEEGQARVRELLAEREKEPQDGKA